MGMGFAPTWLRQASPSPLLHKTTLATEDNRKKLSTNFDEMCDWKRLILFDGNL